MSYKTFDEILSFARKQEKKQRVAIVGSTKEVVIEAAADVVKSGVGIPVLFGDKKKTLEIMKSMNAPDMEIVHCVDDAEAPATAAKFADANKVDLILKGSVPTAMLMKAIFSKELSLRVSPVLSDVFIYEDPMQPEGDKRLIGLTDGGLIPLPDLPTKIEMTRSAVKVFHKLGFEKPKVAYISAVEKVTNKIQSTVDAGAIKEMQAKGKLSDINAYLDGPFAIDNVISKESAEIKGIDSVMAGNADILVVPNIETGNVLGKLVNYYGHAKNGHVITGAKVPILITSRSDDAETKLNSVALGVLVSI